MQKITINITDEARFVVVATLIDQSEVIQFIQEMRQRLGLTDALIAHELFDSEYKRLSYKLDQHEQAEYDKIHERYEWLREKSDWGNKKELTMLENEVLAWQQPLFNFEKKVGQLLAKYEYGQDLRTALLKAIVCGQIEDDDYKGRSSREQAPMIIRDREWYWANCVFEGKDRKGYQKIANENGIDNRNTVRNAIKSYQRRLIEVTLGVHT